MMLQRNKSYKAVKPSLTVGNIRRILESLNIITYENNFESTDIKLYSTKLLINDLDSFGIGSSGKGVERTYSLASAYGELIERLQNGILLNKKTSFAAKIKFTKKLKNLGFKIFFYPSSFPTCMLYHYNSFVIDPKVIFTNVGISLGIKKLIWAILAIFNKL